MPELNTPTESIEITYLGHSSLLIEVRTPSGHGTRILLDPGNLTPPLEKLAPVDAVLITHSHPDHLDPAQIHRLTASGTVPVFGPADVEGELRGTDTHVTVVESGAFQISGVPVTATRTAHETLYPGVPLPENLSYMIAGRVFVPGDALALPTREVDVLLAPLAGPWMKLADGVDFVRAVAPRTVIPIHDAGLAPAHRALHRAVVSSFAPEGTALKVLDQGWSLSC
ncbi:MBL fold metallo-hydrolase [Actinacidiphila sp. DG2A-62]|uniref:MBL fold metallo-hydrolase n=1 Tax=Actinacidiphila sp. DG2A-62 TaxID=3108821 RepID=UPI002DBF3B38|nr:MBL fold metallo-hydrolase [Actinacidiphila sp. DG2A-62]MEC3997078.1 MBL fold metallo-hydrolase [Actinacidiphila sp. DG2A-62]